MTEIDKTNSGVNIEGDIIRFDVVGVIDDTEAEKLHHVGAKALESGSVSNVLINLGGTHRFSSSARKHLVAFLQNPHVHKTAIIGGNVFMKTVASFVIAAAKVDNIRFFDSESQAREWLV